jgi:hypothetical protein
MAPPWVTFDSIAYFNGSCANGADPDIASLGVLLLYTISSLPNHSYAIGRPLLRARQHNDNVGIRAGHDPRPSLRFQRAIYTTRAGTVCQREVSRYGVEEGLCVASVFGSVDYWIGGSAACHGVCGVAVRVVKGKIMSQ